MYSLINKYQFIWKSKERKWCLNTTFGVVHSVSHLSYIPESDYNNNRRILSHTGEVNMLAFCFASVKFTLIEVLKKNSFYISPNGNHMALFNIIILGKQLGDIAFHWQAVAFWSVLKCPYLMLRNSLHIGYHISLFRFPDMHWKWKGSVWENIIRSANT